MPDTPLSQVNSLAPFPDGYFKLILLKSLVCSLQPLIRGRWPSIQCQKKRKPANTDALHSPPNNYTPRFARLLLNPLPLSESQSHMLSGSCLLHFPWYTYSSDNPALVCLPPLLCWVFHSSFELAQVPLIKKQTIPIQCPLLCFFLTVAK